MPVSYTHLDVYKIQGYNYEDAIVLNERVVREDLLTSVHVEEYSLEVRETKRGMEAVSYTHLDVYKRQKVDGLILM